MTYATFLESKLSKVQSHGFEPDLLPNFLFDYQAYIVRLALAKGRFAVFANTGMGKTAIQLAWAKLVHEYTQQPVLILAPLSVAKQTAFDESEKFAIAVQYCESSKDVVNGVNVTNYEKLAKFDCSVFAGVVLDESSILKSYTGAICQSIIDSFADTPYRLACSATPSPNDHMELGNHSAFLGIMSRTEMLAQYFIHDGGDTSKWRLKKHGQAPFWKWLSEWSTMIQKPSDIGFSDDAYVLPRLSEHYIEIETDIKRGGELFSMTATGLLEQRQVKKQTLDMRINAIADLVNNSDEQWLVWCETNDESAQLKAAISDAIEVKGSDKDSHKEDSARDFAHGNIRVLVSKASIFGFGLNFQSCHNMAFVSLSNSFEMTYQAIRRCYRFGQKNDVNVYYAVTDTCGAIKDNILRKTQQFEEMFAELVKYMGTQTMETTKRQSNEYTESIAEGSSYKLHLGDCVDVVSRLADKSVDYSVFSPPFSSLYTYSNSDRDMGNSLNDDEFFKHFDFLIAELHRVLKSGRLISFHCMDLPVIKQNFGYIGVRDFRGDLIRAFEKHGFVLHSQVVIWKDPVIAMQRTKALGLLHKQVKKDSAMSRQGLPDYLVTMRKLGDNQEPIAGEFQEYHGDEDFRYTGDKTRDSINIWQRYASPVWMDINPSDVLGYKDARHDDDERHICPLQLTVIRRALQLWSNPGDTVLSPFAGIGSEGVVSLEMGRKFIGAELKESYWDIAKKNLAKSDNAPVQTNLFESVA